MSELDRCQVLEPAGRRWRRLAGKSKATAAGEEAAAGGRLSHLPILQRVSNTAGLRVPMPHCSEERARTVLHSGMVGFRRGSEGMCEGVTQSHNSHESVDKSEY